MCGEGGPSNQTNTGRRLARFRQTDRRALMGTYGVYLAAAGLVLALRRRRGGGGRRVVKFAVAPNREQETTEMN